MIQFECPACSKGLRVKPELAGKKVKCPKCGQAVLVPAEAASPVPAGGSAPGDPAEEKTRPPQHASAPDNLNAPTLLPANAPTADPEQDTNPAIKPDATHDDSEDDRGLTDFLAPPQQPDEIGRLGIYRVLKVLGAGGMGVVYKAEDPGLKRLVAIKAMLPAIAASATAKKRFLREAQAAAAIKHVHIVTIFQVGEDRGVPFLAMEFLKGEPLDERLKRETILPMAETLRIGREMAEGMAAAHEEGLIHRDIKPANTWLEGKKGHVKILDFGLARSTTDQAHLTQSGAIIGTPAYMAPEQGRGEKVDARGDLWSLGVMLYRMCTGEVPFKGNDTVSTLMAVAMEDPPPPAQINPEVPAELSDLVMKLLEKDPAKRIATADEVARTLERMQKDLARREAAREQTLAQSHVPAKADRRLVSSPSLKEAAGERPTFPSERGGGGEGGPRRRKLPRVLVALLLLALLGGGTLAIVVLLWQTPSGVVRIEINDPNIEVTYGKAGAVIKGADKHDITLAAGEHFLKVKRGDLEFDTDKFILKKGETITLKIEWFKEGKLQVVQDGRVIKEKALAKVDEPPSKTPEKVITNSLGMKLVYIPPGKFMMGSSPQEIERCFKLAEWARDHLPAEGPEHPVEITQGFYLGATEVTVGQFRKFVEEKKYDVGDDRWKPPAPGEFEDHPVAWVSWQNAVDFCKWLSEKEGKQYRLPTEAQWEYSCRAGNAGTRYSFGDDESQLEDYAWYKKNSPKGRSPVATRKPNDWGLYDMHGSQWEWCQDVYDANYYKTSPKQDPQGPAGTGKRVVRGGSHFDHVAVVCRSASRHWGDPGVRSFNYGFRVLLVKADGSPVTARPVAGGYALRFQGANTVQVPSLKVGQTAPATWEGYVTLLGETGKVFAGEGVMLWIPRPDFIWRFATNGAFLHAGKPEPGQRVHIAAVRTDKEIRLYQNGRLLGTQSIKASEATHNAFQLGGDNSDTLISEFRISKVARYDKDFSPAKRFGTDADTVALYHFDEGQGDKLIDSSGNGHHGKIVGAKWVNADGTPIAAAPGPWQPVFGLAKGAALKPGYVTPGKPAGSLRAVAEAGGTVLKVDGNGRWDSWLGGNFHLRMQLRWRASGGDAANKFAVQYHRNDKDFFSYYVGVNGDVGAYAFGKNYLADQGELRDGQVVSKGTPWKWQPVPVLTKIPTGAGQWHTLELICLGDAAIHMLDGKVLGVFARCRTTADGKETPVEKGRLHFELTGGSIDWRNVELRNNAALNATLSIDVRKDSSANGIDGKIIAARVKAVGENPPAEEK